jgi:DNA primase
MARIPDAEIERLKSDVSLVRLIESAGVELKKHGADYHGRCPFHDDKTPSLVVSPQKNLWHCLGACQTGGSVIDWVMKAQGISFRLAAELLRNEQTLGIQRSGDRIPQRGSTQKLPTLLTNAAEDQAALRQVIDYYHQALKQSPECLAYLESRGLKNAELIDTFKLGFANRTLGYRLPDKNRKAGAALRGQLQRLGLLRESSGHEHFNGSLVVPIVDPHGLITEVYGRKITPKLRPGTPYHLYLPGSHVGVWNVSALHSHKEIILCEALIDALTFWVHGFRNVTASYGVSGFTADHLAAFKQHHTARVLIAYDRDEAGDKAAEKLAAQLMVEGIECFRIQFPKGMDANEYALKVQPAAKSLGLVIRKAAWLGRGAAPKIDSAASPLAAAVPNEKRDKAGALAAAVEPTAASLAADPVALPVMADVADVTPTEVIALPESPASPIPAGPAAEIEPEITEQEIVFTFGPRRWRVRGLSQNQSYNLLKVNLLVSRDEAFHVDTFDLYAARLRAAYLKQASLELGLKEEVLKKDLGQVLLKLEGLQDQQIKNALAPKEKTVSIEEKDKAAALALLTSPDLLQHILRDFERCGVVGEQTNKLVGYLAAVSRKLERPLAVLVQSSSAAGKSSLMEAVLAFMPTEEQVNYSAMTGQALFYLGEHNVKHKILSVAEEEGASRASYALKLLQSEGELNIASTGKDPVTGKLITHEYRVEGPVMIFSTTTAIDVDEELLNRCVVLSVNESREQTRAIHAQQRSRRTLAGLQSSVERKAVRALHQNAQRLLKPLAVLNPYSDALTFVDDKTRTRRDHEKYLTLIDVIALLHQYQRPIKTTHIGGESVPYIEATLDDIATANRLAHDVLGRTLDELPPQTRTLLLKIEAMVKQACEEQHIDRADYRFSRKEVRASVAWSDTQLRVHLDRLTAMEYLLVHRGGRGQSFVYELMYDGQGKEGQPFCMGLIDVDALRASATTESSRGSEGEFAGSKRPQNGGIAAGSRIEVSPTTAGESDTNESFTRKNALKGEEVEAASYRSAHRNSITDHTTLTLAAAPVAP